MNKKYLATIPIFLAIICLILFLILKTSSSQPTKATESLFLQPAPTETNYLYQSMNQPFKVYLGNRLQENKPMIKVEQENSSLEFSLALANSQPSELSPSVQEKSIVYQDVYPGTDVVYSLNEKGIKEEIIINNQEALDYLRQLSPSLSFAFDLNLRNVIPQKSSDEQIAIHFLDPNTGQSRFYIPKPFMVDSKGKRSEEIKIEVGEARESGGYKLTLTPSLDWLSDPSRTYPIVIDPTVTVDTSTSGNATAYASQRKTWYDNNRYWIAFHSDGDNRIEFWYSSDGSTWYENETARLSYDINDFSIEADSSNAFIVYTNGYDIEGKPATSYPGTGFGWGSTVTVLNGSGTTDEYDYPVITRDSSNYVWVAARYTGSGVYYMKAIKETGAANDLPEDPGDTVYSISDTSNSNSNVYGVINPLTSQDMYATWIENANIEGRVWDNSGTQWEDSLGETTYPDGIDDGVSGLTNNHSALSDSSGNVHLAYTDSSNNIDYQQYQIPSRGYDAPIFTDGWESGDTSAWTGKIDTDITASTASTWRGDYGLQAVVNDTSAILVYKTLTAGDEFYARVYFNPNNITLSTTNDFIFIQLAYTGVEPNLMEVRIRCTTGCASYEIRVLGEDESGWWNGDYEEIDDDWHWIEIRWKRETGPSTNDGIYTFWIDGTQEYNKTDGNCNSYQVDRVKIGAIRAISATADGTMYFDNFALDDAAIGEYPWSDPVNLDSNSGNEYPTISVDTANSDDLYAFWIRNNDIFYKKGSSPYESANWGTLQTLESSGTNDWLSSSYEDFGSNSNFVVWTEGTGSPYDINFNFVGEGPPTPPPGANFRFEGVQMEGVRIE